MPVIAPCIRPQFLDLNGDPVVGGLLYSYEAGTSTSKKATYSNVGGTLNTNPVVLDSEGRCQLYLDNEAYKFVLTNADGVGIWSEDNVSTNSVATSQNGADITGDVTIVGALDIQHGLLGLTLGADLGLTTRTDETTKWGILCSPHYLNAEAPAAAIVMQNTVDGNVLHIGGGRSELNAATEIYFLIGADNTTTTGSNVVKIASDGLTVVGNDLTVSNGTATFSPAGSDLAIDANGAADISGVLTLQSELNADAGADIEGAVDINGALTVHSAVDISYGGVSSLLIGADTGAATRTNDTEKVAIISAPAYDAEEENTAIIRYDNAVGNSVVYIGGGSSSLNAATKIGFYTAANATTLTGTERMYIHSDGSVVVGSPTGSAKGAGTINAVAVYDDNVLLTGYVLDKVYNPDFDILNWKEKGVEKQAAEFCDRTYLLMLDLEDYCEFIKSRRMLPTFEEIESTGNIPSTGAMIQRLWEVVEIQAVQIAELHERLKALES